MTQKKSSMTIVETTIGRKFLNKNNDVVKIECDYSMNGYCYKDISAWHNNKGVIYAPEYAFEDAEDEEGCFIEGQELKAQWTRKSWIEWVRNVVYHHNYEEIATLSDSEKDLLINEVAYDCLENCDWEDLSTYLESWDWEDCIDDLIDIIRK